MSDHESHDRLPIGAGLVLIVLATCQASANLRLDSGLLSAVVYHNLLDGSIALSAAILDHTGGWLRKRHWALNIAPLSALALYVAIVFLIGFGVLAQPPTRFSWSLALVGATDAFINLGIRVWAKRISSSLAQALSLHLLLDALVGPSVLVVSLVPLGSVYTAFTYLLVLAIAGLVLHESLEVMHELHLHGESKCRDRERP